MESLPTIREQQVMNQLSSAAVESASAGFVGFLYGHCAGLIDPLHGGVFCAVATLAAKVFKCVFDYLFTGIASSDATECVGNVVSYAAAILATSLTAQRMGVFIPFPVGVHLTIGMLVCKAIFRVLEDLNTSTKAPVTIIAS